MSRLYRSYPIVFNAVSTDLGGFVEIVTPGAVDRTLTTGAEVLALRNHDSTLTLGRRSAKTLRLTKDTRGLLAETDLEPRISFASDLIHLVERGDALGGSFGFRTLDDMWQLGRDGVPLRYLLDISISEVSLGVSFPAYPSTATAMRTARQERQREQRRYDTILALHR